MFHVCLAMRIYCWCVEFEYQGHEMVVGVCRPGVVSELAISLGVVSIVTEEFYDFVVGNKLVQLTPVFKVHEY